MKNRIVACAVIIGTLATAQAKAHERRLVDLTSVIVAPTQVNNVADILGSGRDGTTLYPALLHNGVLIRLPALNPPSFAGTSNSYSLNNNSQVMYLGYTNGTSGDVSTFVLDVKTGTTVDIGKISGYSSTIGVGFNDSGDVVGYAYSSTGNRPFLWRNGQFSQLAPYPGAPVGTQYSYRFINNRGDVLGVMGGGGVSEWLIWRNGVPAILHLPTQVDPIITPNEVRAFNDKDEVMTVYHDYLYDVSSYHVLTLSTPPIVDGFLGSYNNGILIRYTVDALAFNNLGNVLERSRDAAAGHFGEDWRFGVDGANIPMDYIPMGANLYKFSDVYDINDNVDVLGVAYQIGSGGASGGIFKTVLSQVVPAAVPQITGLTPDRIIPGYPSIPVTINGAGFDPDSTVLLNGAAQASSHYLSATQMRVVMPASLMAQPGTVAIKVVTPAPGGGASNTRFFNVAVARATITDPTPYRIYPFFGSSQQITINGLDFDPGAVLTINDTYTVTPTSVTPYKLTATLPLNVSQTIGKYFVRVVNPGWSNASAPAPLWVTLSEPIIKSMSPDHVGAGLTNLKLNIYGGDIFSSYIQPTVKVSFNGGAPVTPESIAGGRIVVSIPTSLLANPGNVTVRLVDSFEHGGSSAPATLVVASRPTLTSLTPNHAAVGSGAAAVTLTGSNFEASSTVTINNGAPIAATFVSSTQLTVVVPSSVTAVKGNYAVRVVNTGYSNFSNPQAFTVTP
ncbi:MAG: IPT/TIG domain-containing protein [Capsulimonas sp.]|uniref:IPT/TIG domain-containing protein n=1 Tax=Capsulimonas sp. TaxID=2494211 RepID=UPI00326489B2